MVRLFRTSLESDENEKVLQGQWKDIYIQTMSQLKCKKSVRCKRMARWLLSRILLEEQDKATRGITPLPYVAENIGKEVIEEVAAIQSNYGNLCLEGMQYLFTLLFLCSISLWSVPWTINVRGVLSSVVFFLVVYPLVVYSWWKFRTLHYLTQFKVILSGIVAVGMYGMLYFSPFEGINVALNQVILNQFELTPTMVFINISILLGFMIYFRRYNDLAQLQKEYEFRIISLAPLTEKERVRSKEALEKLNAFPLKDGLRKYIKMRCIQKSMVGAVIEMDEFKTAIEKHNVNIHWVYWGGTAVQMSLLYILMTKTMWAAVLGVSSMTDYYDIALRSSSIMGSILCGGIFSVGINYCVRRLIYTGTDKVKIVGAMVVMLAATGITAYLTGMIPLRFPTGSEINPFSNLWALIGYSLLLLHLQYTKQEDLKLS